MKARVDGNYVNGKADEFEPNNQPNEPKRWREPLLLQVRFL